MKKCVMFALCNLLCCGVPTFAQEWPARAVTWIVPFAAGGPTDQVSRYMASKLSLKIGQPVVIENVVGAGGAIGVEKLAKSSPDGYTIATSANTLQGIAPHLSKLPYDTVKSFTAIGGLAAFSYAIVVPIDSPIKTIDALIRKARAEPGKVTAGSAGVGTGVHLGAVLLGQNAGVTFNTIHYKGGGPIMNDMIGGHLDFTLEVIGTALPMVNANRIKIIATTGKQRHVTFPTVPTVSETLSGYEMNGWFAIFTSAGVPENIVLKLNQAINDVARSTDYQNFVAGKGYDIMITTPAELAQLVKTEVIKWGEVIRGIPETGNKN